MNKKKKSRKTKKFRNILKNEINNGNNNKIEDGKNGANLNVKFKESLSKLKNSISKKNNNIKEWQANSLSKMRIYFNKIILRLKKWNNIFCTGMTCQTNLKRDVIIILVAILVAATFLGMGQYVESLKKEIQEKKIEATIQDEVVEQFEEANADKVKIIQDKISTENWKEYESAWYGFKIKYPQDWKAPVVRPYDRTSQALYRASFATDNQVDKNYIGFDVAVYDVNNVKEIFKTDEFPKIKSASPEDAVKCENIEGHLLETGDYPAEEIYIPLGDDCYGAVLFFSVINGQYIYNITPRLREGAMTDNDPMIELSDNLPEFFEAISVFENVDIVRPKSKPKPVAPKITAPHPATYNVDQFGRKVCEKKNDKPGKSDKGKGKHLDMECCLDPDEYPNPHCYYDSAKYGKYLK